MCRFTRVLIFSLLAVALVSTALWAQGIFATLTGVVTDPSNAVVKGAKVTLTDASSGSARETETNSDGYYTFASVPVGTYNVAVEVQGFQTYKADAIALGGAVGSLLRYVVASQVQSAASPGFPWGIFVVNISGGFIMGVIAELGALKMNFTPELRAFLTVGILGGYTTFSTFSLDIVTLINHGEALAAGAYILASVALGVLALYAGLHAMRLVFT